MLAVKVINLNELGRVLYLSRHAPMKTFILLSRFTLQWRRLCVDYIRWLKQFAFFILQLSFGR